jgi:hypothetical protein
MDLAGKMYVFFQTLHISVVATLSSNTGLFTIEPSAQGSPSLALVAISCFDCTPAFTINICFVPEQGVFVCKTPDGHVCLE